MATNENVNKVIYGNQTVMDITDTTAEESDVASGEVFYKANGARSVGTLNKDSAVWGNISGTLSDQNDLQIELNRAYTKTASETSSIDDLDVIPVQKISASSDGRRNIKFKNLKSILKTYFDAIYSTFSGSYNDLTNKPTAGTGIAINNNVIAVDADNTPTENSEKPVKSKGVYEVVEQIYADNGVLGAKNLLNTNEANMRTKSENAIVEELSNGVRIYNTLPGTYQFASYWLKNLPHNIDIKVKSNVNVTSGKGRIMISNRSQPATTLYEKDFSNSGTIDFIFNTGNYELLTVNFYSSAESHISGDVTFSDLMFCLASDPDDTYVPYAMTNRELTDSRDVWTATATVSSSGTVTFTGLNDSYGYSRPYYDLPSGDSAYTYSKVTKSGSGTSVTLTYTTDAPTGTVCKLRILK